MTKPHEPDTKDLPSGSTAFQIFLFLLTLSLYLGLSSRLYFGEGMKWAILLKQGWTPVQFHPHHLLYNPAGLLLYRFISLFHADLNPIHALLLLDALFGAAGAVLFYRTALMLTRNRLVASAVPIGLAFSWGYWSHSQNVEVYVPSCFFLFLVLHLVLKRVIHDQRTQWVLPGLAFSAACLFHQANIFYLPVPLAGILLLSEPRRDKIRHLLQFSLTCGTFTVAPYLMVAFLIRGDRSTAQIERWILAYGYTVSDYYWRFTMSSLKCVVGSLQIIFMDFIPSSLGKTSRHVSDGSLSVMKGGILCLTAFLLIFRSGSGWRSFLRFHKKPLALCAVSILSQGLFFTFWDPGGWFFWIQHLAPLWLVLAMLAAYPQDRKKAASLRLILLCAMVGLLFLVNLFNSVIPLHDAEGVADARYLQFLEQHTTPGDLALFTSTGVKMIPNLGGPLCYLYCELFGSFELDSFLPSVRTPPGAEALAGKIRRFLNHGSHVYSVTTVKRGKHLKKQAREAVRKFLDDAGFEQVPVAEYVEDTIYKGNTLYRIELKKNPQTSQPLSHLPS